MALRKPRPLTVVVMTMVRDEAAMLPRWIGHYGRHVGVENLIVLDDNSVDGSTDDLPCTVYRLPPPPWDRGWGKTRAQLVNGLAAGLLACNDVVIFTDADEFLLPDPRRYDDLRHYLTARADRDVIAPVALEVMHMTRLEPPLDPYRPVLDQRRFVKYSPVMCKPLVKRVRRPWTPAFHAIQAPFEVDPELFMFHLKFADEAVLEQTAEHRRAVHEVEGRGHRLSFWPWGAEKLKGRLATWTGSADGDAVVPLFDSAELNVDGLVRKKSNGFWAVAGPRQVKGLRKSPLLELPQHFRRAL
jgi:hypothetical protein